MSNSFLLKRSLWLWGLACLAVLITSSVWAADGSLDLTESEQRWLDSHPEISLTFDGFNPPYRFENEQGELKGFSVDLIRLIGKQTGIEFELNVKPGVLNDSVYNQSAQVDVVATGLPETEISSDFSLTKAYIQKPLVVITRADNNTINLREEVAGKALALIRHHPYAQRISQQYPSVKPLYVDSMLEALNAVSLGNADGAISYLGEGHYFRNKYQITNLKYATVYQKQAASERFAIRKDWPELHGIINKALASISDRQLQQLHNKWLPVDYMENLVDIGLTEAEKLWIAQHQQIIRLGVDPEFAPFEYLEDGHYQGMASDYVKLLNQRLGLNMQIIEGIGWKEVIDRTERGEIDVLPAVGVTEERSGYLSFTDSYLSYHRVIVTREDTPFISGLQDLSQLSVAVQANTSHHGYIKEHSDIQPQLYKTLQDSLLAVSGGEVDSFVGNVASATYWIRKLHLSNLKIAAPVSNDVQTLHFAVRKGWPELVTILQKGLDSISPMQRKMISEKWLAVEYSPTMDYSLLWRVVGGFSLLVITVLLWNVMLNRKVQRRTSQLEYSASYDQLTDLPNRFLVQDRLSHLIDDARRAQKKVALISVDINDFKKINEAFGHKTGDTILSEFANRLKNILSEGQTAGRLGGNQFLVVQGNLTDVEDSVALAERIISCTRDKFNSLDQPVSLTVGLGISLYPNDGDTAELLLKYADTATHYAKEQSQGYAFYTDNLIRNVSRRLELERYMFEALANNEFEVYFQPKVESGSRRIVSFEALLRWHNKEMGMVSPAEFIPIAEKNGSIEEIGLFVMEQSLAALEYWQHRYQTSFSIAVNLSPIQFRSEDLIPTIESLILNYGLRSKNIEFEITEGLLLSDYPMIEEQLRRLESLGVTLAMDDFGTGYSSLSYLRKYKFDTLKIDREFISDLPTVEADRKLVAATIAMAHELGMKVVAEGVETEEQCNILVENNCDILQGWLFSKAMTLKDTTAMLDGQYEQIDEVEV